MPNEDQVFRFLDLPAEMRNLSYRELLVWPSNRLERCWPQILSTCRQVNDEAKDIIYKENAGKVKVVIEDAGDGRPQDVAIILSRVIYTLSSAFLHCKKLEKLIIRFYGLEVEVGNQFGKGILWSLSKLGLPAAALSIKGLHTNETTNWAEFITNCDPGSPGDIMQRLYQAHVGSQRLEDSLDLNEPAINIVTQAAYDEIDRPVGDCQDIYREEFVSLTACILDREEEKCMIDITERLELWVKTTVQALEMDAELAKARIDAIIRKFRKIAELPES
ncbi:hypothetical protein D0865_10058 [Hortaea werneckii]|uniref:Uncharacterized protein n=1 Tax=Hortaea werneckii TaxID=91943 RepID=A0A3M7C085_HORWE|nr:hypothetical protein D0865_10058 [Hortaea werneckii]